MEDFQLIVEKAAIRLQLMLWIESTLSSAYPRYRHKKRRFPFGEGNAFYGRAA